MRHIIWHAKTVSEAVDQACETLGVGLNDIKYDVLDEGSKGFFGIGAKPARVIITCESSLN